MAVFSDWLRHSGVRIPRFLSNDGQAVRFTPRYARDRRFVSDSAGESTAVRVGVPCGSGDRRRRSSVAIMASLSVVFGRMA